MTTSPNGVEWKLLGRITVSLLPRFWRCQQVILGLLAGDFPLPSGPDYTFNGAVDEGNRKFNYSPYERGGRHALITPTFL